MSETRAAARLGLRCREDPETVPSTVSTAAVVSAGKHPDGQMSRCFLLFLFHHLAALGLGLGDDLFLLHGRDVIVV